MQELSVKKNLTFMLKARINCDLDLKLFIYYQSLIHLLPFGVE